MTSVPPLVAPRNNPSNLPPIPIQNVVVAIDTDGDPNENGLDIHWGSNYQCSCQFCCDTVCHLYCG
jgi:hypothetical protein